MQRREELSLRERELLAQSHLATLSADDPRGAACGCCRRPILWHDLDEARECAQVLIESEATYCRLTGPKH